MLHLGGNEAPEAYLVLTTIVQRSSNKVHHVTEMDKRRRRVVVA